MLIITLTSFSYLFDLDTTEDPAWFYLSSQYKWITSQLNNTYNEGVRKIDLWKSGIYAEESDVIRSLSLKNATSHIHLKDSDFGAESDPELKAWRATLDLVKTTSNLLLRCLPDFWKLATSFIEGKFAAKVSSCSGQTVVPAEGIQMDILTTLCLTRIHKRFQLARGERDKELI